MTKEENKTSKLVPVVQKPEIITLEDIENETLDVEKIEQKVEVKNEKKQTFEAPIQKKEKGFDLGDTVPTHLKSILFKDIKPPDLR